MASYRALEPGLYELDTPAGPLPVTASEDELRAAGHIPEELSLMAKGSGALASNAQGIDNSAGLDALRSGGAQFFDPSSPPPAPAAPPKTADQRFAEASAATAPFPGLGSALGLANPSVPMHSERQAPAPGIRGGGEVKKVDEFGAGAAPSGQQGAPQARFVRTPARDIRAGFTVSKTGLDPADIEAAELAESDASIDRKLGAQNIADRRATQTEELSAEMGRQIRREGVALRQLEERNKAQREDYGRRQMAIDEERERIGTLKVTPAELVAEGDATGIIAALAMLAAGAAAPQFGGRNLAREAIQQNLDRKVDELKASVSGKENELERLTKIFGSPAEAEAEYRDRQRLMVQAMGQKMATDAGALDAADALRMQFADWDDERAQSRLQRQAALAGNVTEQWAYQPERVVQIGGQKPLKPDERERMVRLPNGAFVFARTKNDAEKVQTQLTSGTAVLDGLGKLRSVMADGQPWTPEKRGRAQSIAAALALDIKNADQAGALDKGTQEIVTAMTSDPNDLINPAAVSRIDAASERQRGKTSGLVRDYLHTDSEATTPVSSARPQSVRAE